MRCGISLEDRDSFWGGGEKKKRKDKRPKIQDLKRKMKIGIREKKGVNNVKSPLNWTDRFSILSQFKRFWLSEEDLLDQGRT